MAVAADDAALDHGMLADAGIRPDDTAGDVGLLLDDNTTPDHRVRADHRARFDLRATVDEAGCVEPRSVLDSRVHGDDRPMTVGGGKRAAHEPAVEHIVMNLDVLLRSADVDPVTA